MKSYENHHFLFGFPPGTRPSNASTVGLQRSPRAGHGAWGDPGDHQLRLHAFAKSRLVRGHRFHHLLHLGENDEDLGEDIR